MTNTAQKSSAWYARRYTERYGFHVVPIEPKRKFPRATDWGNICLTDPAAAEQFYTEHADWNLGVALGPSRMCSLDIDCLPSFRLICECFGINLDELIASTPTIQGRSDGLRLMFRVPNGASLDYQKINWKPRNDPTGEKHKSAMAAAKAARDAGNTERADRIARVAKRWAIYTVFEMRAATDGRQRQDVLPPSIHPDTGQPYRWVTQPRADWPEPPRWLLAMWGDFAPFKKQIAAMCPWSPASDLPADVPAKAATASQPVQFRGTSVIDQYAREVAIEQALTDHGYRQISRNRWLSPHSGTGLPGVVILPGKNSCWIHHASDPLCSESSGRPVNPFDLFCYYTHGGDVRRAVAALRPAGIGSKHHEQASQPADAAPPTPAPSRDIMSPLPWTNDKCKPLAHIDNLREICNRLGVNVRYNVIRKEDELIIPNASFSIDNEANASLAWLTSECSLFGFPTDKLKPFVTYLADQNPYNPVASWIDSAPWDGLDRVQQLCDTVTARGQAVPAVQWLKETLIRRWLISAVAAAYRPAGVSAAGVLVFQGAQYLGKTKWFKTLVPPDLGLLKDGMILRPDDKDSIKQAVSYWLVELGELDATFRKSDIAALKSFITNDADVLRRPYAERESRFARRTVFFGSVNPREFLHDPTGNRRYWTVECEAIDHSHNIDMQQCWAQVKHYWQAGESYYLTADEMDALNDHNNDFAQLEPIEERILSGLEWNAAPSFWRWAQATEVLIEVGVDRPSRADAATAAALLRAKNGDQVRKSNGKKLILVPPVART